MIALRSLLAPVFAAAALAFLAGCSTDTGSYLSPNSGSESLIKQALIDDPSVATELARKPAATFPAHILVARTSGGDGYSYAGTYYHGGLILQDTPESERVQQVLEAQPGVASVVPVNKFLLGDGRADTMVALRRAAAKVQADLVFLYAESRGRRVVDQLPIVSFLTLGLAPLQKIDAEASVSGVLVDVRTGFIYGVINASAFDDGRNIGWFSRAHSKSMEEDMSAAAIAKFIERIPGFWKGVDTRYAKPGEFRPVIPVDLVAPSPTPAAAN